MSAFARQLVRSHPARTLVRPRFNAIRNYSETKAGQPSESESPAPQQQDTQPESLSPEAEKLKTKEAEVVDLTGRLRYLQADFLNLQRNSAREKEQTRDFAISRFASDLLETVDVLSLALKSVPANALSSSVPSESSQISENASEPISKTPLAYLQELHTGVEMTQRQLLQTLFKYHVKPFDPTGDKFDPNRHEALYQAPIPGKEPGTVLECQKSGYMIKDRVLRAAQVGVVQDTSP
ncbi:hypothetical protein D9757_001884 [Collybiopsis confluens]|uniref:GrpE protein homolog, mitochondrial n=1 Tax=Collybiopsis confluens TaxID=2823264 RepID=A0A8H5MEX0_9AGAR|nr:hypothetical protein D9757_001884 [Collybiopsis confluens]